VLGPLGAPLAPLDGLRSLARVFVQETTAALSDKTDQIYIRDQTFAMLGNTWWVPLVIFLSISFLAWLLMSRTVVGRHLYAMGGNEAAARLSGIRTDRLKWLAYCIGAMSASIAGILYTADVGASIPLTQGMGYELNAIAAAHPDLVRISNIGTSYQGRQMVAIKISDNVATDEDEPEVLFTHGQHAREHLTIEMAVYLAHLFAEDADSRVRTGTPRKLRIGGWFAGNPTEAAWEARSSTRSGCGLTISSPSSPLPSGGWPIRARVSSSIPT